LQNEEKKRKEKNSLKRISRIWYFLDFIKWIGDWKWTIASWI